MTFDEFVSKTYQDRATELASNDVWMKERTAELKARKPKDTQRGSFLFLACDPYWMEKSREAYEAGSVGVARVYLVWYGRIFS